MSALYLHETVSGGPGEVRPEPGGPQGAPSRGARRRVKVWRGLSDLVVALAVVVFLCSAVALRVLDSLPLALMGVPLGLGLLWVSRVVERPFAARRSVRPDRDEGETEPLPVGLEREHRSAA